MKWLILVHIKDLKTADVVWYGNKWHRVVVLNGGDLVLLYPEDKSGVQAFTPIGTWDDSEDLYFYREETVPVEPEPAPLFFASSHIDERQYYGSFYWGE